LSFTVTVRIAQPIDAAAIAETLRAAFAPFEGRYTPAAFTATTPTASQVADRFQEGPIWLAEQEGRVVGTVSVVPRSGDLYLRSMAVHPTAQGQGIGARLLAAVEGFAKPGYRRIVLTTTPFLDAAIRLYQRAGFRSTDEHADLFGTPLVWMVKAL
jgi:ribosomal protein S18 acetylase RimI-like enzyme